MTKSIERRGGKRWRSGPAKGTPKKRRGIPHAPAPAPSDPRLDSLRARADAAVMAGDLERAAKYLVRALRLERELSRPKAPYAPRRPPSAPQPDMFDLPDEGAPSGPTGVQK
jgi:hypothetical protein